ncbi:MAG: T9SS type A sorting domain-containing protein [Candidatus Eisenbacteria bacterium]|nr:T9SS type A sorting domain-containing protein [Candidatus Eisenbacteria bacterium]
MWQGVRAPGRHQEGPRRAVPRFAAVHPNPSSPRTVLAFTVPEAGHVRLEVFDLRGCRVATVLDRSLTAGRHEATWDAPELPCGVFFARLTAAGGTATTTLTLLR